MHSSYGLWQISEVWVVGETVCSLRCSLSGLLSESWLHLTITPAPVGKLRLFIWEFFLPYREVHNFIIQCPAFIKQIWMVHQDVQYSCSELIGMLCPSKMRRFEERVCCSSRGHTTICDCRGPTTALKPVAQTLVHCQLHVHPRKTTHLSSPCVAGKFHWSFLAREYSSWSATMTGACWGWRCVTRALTTFMAWYIIATESATCGKVATEIMVSQDCNVLVGDMNSKQPMKQNIGLTTLASQKLPSCHQGSCPESFHPVDGQATMQAVEDVLL